MWILKKSYLDLPLILLPGLFGLIIIKMFPETDLLPLGLVIFYFITKSFIDAGHVYATLWRTLFNKEERNANKMYLTTPLLLTVIILVWTLLKIPHFNFVILLAFIWHNNRQYYGIQKWYQQLNNRYSKSADLFFNLLIWFPIFVAPFNPTNYPVNWIRMLIFPIGLYLYFGIVAAWIIYEISIKLKGHNELNRVLAIGVPAFLIALTCLSKQLSTTPFLLAHGLPYIAITTLSMKKIKPQQFSSITKSLFLMLVVVIFFGTIHGQWYKITNYLFIDYSVIFASNNTNPDLKTLLQIFIFRIPFIPLLCHYYWDGFIWKRKHPDAHLIYAE